MALQERVAEAQRNSKMELKDLNEKQGKKGRKRGPQDDTEQSSGLRKRMKGGNKSKKKFNKKKHK